MKLSNIIEEFIKDMLEESREVELQRNELASRFNCVPSQINYVISTRFSPERGYSVESRRGGGGYIRITQTAPRDESYIIHAVNAIGDSITYASSCALLQDMYALGIINHREEKIIMAALNDNSIPVIPAQKGAVRAKMLKNILVNLV
ncbi:MAG: CtsR family transcriptional regulator [Clostridia bacterium]|nr:CtsR family transcriptional regulator [Clostridia bacterium]